MTSDFDPIQIRAREILMQFSTPRDLPPSDEAIREALAQAEREAACDHEWKYLEREPGETYTGYCEQCSKCQAIQQIPQ